MAWMMAGAAIAWSPPAANAATFGGSVAAQAQVPSIAEVIANVRQAVGYNRISRFAPAFTITEQGADGAASELHFGTRRGELRNEGEFIHDGRLAWQRDSRRGIMVPSALRQREKAAWPLWVRGHWWLNPQSGFHGRVDAAQSNAVEVAVLLSLPEGIVGATVFIDTTSWLPVRLVVPYERGPFTQHYRQYRSVDGVKFASEVETSYRDTSLRRLVSVARLPSAADFRRPAVPADHRFDARRPARLETRAGAPFANGTPGHVYVRGSIDDAREGWWHFDSGADSSIIDESVAEQLGMEVIGTHRSMGADGNVREGTWRRGRSLTIGRIRMENPIFRALDLSANNAPPGERRMGTLGYDLFARAVVEYAGGGSFVRICNPATYRLPRGAHWQKLQHIDSTPAFPGSVEGRLGLFQLDTGTAGSVDFTKHFHEAAGLLRNRNTRRVEVAGSGGSFPVEVGRVTDFRLAGQLYADLEVAFRTGGVSREGSAGTVGRGSSTGSRWSSTIPASGSPSCRQAVPAPADERPGKWQSAGGARAGYCSAPSPGLRPRGFLDFQTTLRPLGTCHLPEPVRTRSDPQRSQRVKYQPLFQTSSGSGRWKPRLHVSAMGVT
jgi:hypothetical protein